MEITFNKEFTLSLSSDRIKSALRVIAGVIVVCTFAASCAVFYVTEEIYDLSKLDEFSADLLHYGIPIDTGLFGLGYAAGMFNMISLYVGVSCMPMIFRAVIDAFSRHKKARVGRES